MYKQFKQRLGSLIATPSVSCTLASHDMSNRPAIDLLSSWFEHKGFDCRIQELQPNKANLIACLGRGSGGLVLSGHSDTVPFDESRWQSNPLAVDERDSRFFGLGSCDMKGFFAVILAALDELQLTISELKKPLIVLATADEESSMSGARALCAADLLNSRYAIIGEPTGLVPIYMHKGIGMHRLNIKGRAGHSSNPELGNNAIEAMHEVIGELLSFRTDMQKQHQNPAFAIASPTMNLGCVHGGDNPNRICGSCELDFDLRPLPGMELEQLQEAIDARLQLIAERRGVELQLDKLFDGVDAFAEHKDSELISLAEELSGHSAETVAFATEAPFLKKLGMQTVVLGPGSIDQAHQPDEFLHFDQIKPAVNIVKSAIKRYCL
ncbi:acetylornithine deacetylase [Agaribacterium haliotis]|uniref:acetylornithine deacetylase n=1 Tax=Agaribacterium haliotis TaxID=2013869 RepID=UPI000BB56ECA|nr:acetylornithine deacetylase [Agaribacterium haliotis]